MHLSLLLPTKHRPQWAMWTIKLVQEAMRRVPHVEYEILVGDASERPLISQGPVEVHAWKEPLAKTLNGLVEQARGEYVWFLNDDLFPYEETFAQGWQLMRQLPKRSVGICFQEKVTEPCRAYPVLPEFSVMSKETFQSVGGYDEQFDKYFDVDFGYRALAAHVPLVLLAGVCFWHHQLAVPDCRADQSKLYAKYPQGTIVGYEHQVQGRTEFVELNVAKLCMAHYNEKSRAWDRTKEEIHAVTKGVE